jgi:hypothetical protein
MPIKGVSDVHIKLPVLGKIRGGVKKMSKKGTEFPNETPYFFINPLVEVEERGKPVIDKKTGKPMVRTNEDLQRAIEILGTNQPTELTVTFPIDPLDQPDLCLSSYLKWWGNGTMKCIGDNEDAHYVGKDQVPGLNHPDVDTSKLISKVPMRYANRKCSMDTCPQYMSGACKAEANIRFLIPEVSGNGLFQLDTRSWQAITEIGTTLSLIKKDLQRRGYKSLAYVPLKLFKQPRKNTKSAGGENYIIQIRLAEETLKAEEAKLLEGGSSYVQNALPNGTSENLIPQITPIDPAEANYDLLEQSHHGHYQTGDDAIVIDAPKVEGPEDWIEDEQIQRGFKAMADLMGTKVTKAKMKARAMKYNNKQDLLNYLIEQVNTLKAEQTQQGAGA